MNCDICASDIRAYYDVSKELVRRSKELHSLASKHIASQKLFASGRVVILRDGVRSLEVEKTDSDFFSQHFPGNIAVLLSKAPLGAIAHGLGEKETPYFVLAVTDPVNKSGVNGKSLGVTCGLLLTIPQTHLWRGSRPNGSYHHRN
jgi:hypothetical protein